MFVACASSIPTLFSTFLRGNHDHAAFLDVDLDVTLQTFNKTVGDHRLLSGHAGSELSGFLGALIVLASFDAKQMSGGALVQSAARELTLRGIKEHDLLLRVLQVLTGSRIVLIDIDVDRLVVII